MCSRSWPPERYGYQSARAGSHRWTWASTTRSISIGIDYSLVTVGERLVRRSELVGGVGCDSTQDAVEPIRYRRATITNRRCWLRVTAQPDPSGARDQLGARQVDSVGPA